MDLAPSLERYDMGDRDWTISTRLSFPEEFGSPAGTHHVGLMFGYGRGAPDDAFNDVTYWGQYGAAGVLRVERTGAAITPQIPYDGAPVSLQIQKSAETVTFSHRQDDADPWITDAQYNIQLPYPANGAASPPAGTPVSRVGLLIKSWGGAAPEVVADFDYFCLKVLDSPPVARVTATPDTGVSPLEVMLSSAGSLDPSGGPLTYAWDFGDGSPGDAGAEVKHTYTAGGIYTVTLTATDDERNSGRATATLRISDDPTPFTFTRIGTQGDAGIATVDKTGPKPVYCLDVGGNSLAITMDNAFILHQKLAGDFVVRAKMLSGAFPAPRAAAGLTARLNLENRSANAAMLVDGPNDGYSFQVRSVDGRATIKSGGPVDPPRGVPGFPVWLQLERTGKTFIGSYSTDGLAFSEYSRADVDSLNVAELFVGFAATSGDNNFRAEYCAELEFGSPPPPEKQFHRGDADQNQLLQLTDAVQILSYLFLGTVTRVPNCFDAADADDNGIVQLTDAVRILGFLFLGSAPPAPPGPPPEPCGADTTADELANEDCTYEGC